MVKLLGFLSNSTDPYLNLSIENWVLLNLKEEERALFSWRNSPCVVLGRFQNPWLECDLRLMERDEVKLVRRQSGGGCVYHDLGNVNHSFLSCSRDIDKKMNAQVLQKALHSLEIEAEVNERHDLLLNGKKISGSAFKQKRDRSFHHGTMLIKTDLDKLNDYIHSPLKVAESKSIPSVRSKVANLIEAKKSLEFKEYQDALFRSFKSIDHHEFIFHILDEGEALKIKEIRDYYEELINDSWLLGETPKFCIEDMEKGHLLESNKGRITKLVLNNTEVCDLEGVMLKKENLLVRRMSDPWLKEICY